VYTEKKNSFAKKNRAPIATLLPLVVALLAGCGLFGCSFVDEKPPSLTMRLVSPESDSISIFATLYFAFSFPIVEEQVQFAILPDPGTVFSTRLNTTRDTLILEVTGGLEGSTEYTMLPAHDIRGENGTTLSAEKAAFTLYTHAAEKEPNDRPDTLIADRFVSPVFGTVRMVNDTDYFFVSQPLSGALSLRSFGPYRCRMQLLSAGQRFVVPAGEENLTNTFAIPDTVAFPLYVAVYSDRPIAQQRYVLEMPGN
jgi:hypothetical protein